MEGKAAMQRAFTQNNLLPGTKVHISLSNSTPKTWEQSLEETFFGKLFHCQQFLYTKEFIVENHTNVQDKCMLGGGGEAL